MSLKKKLSKIMAATLIGVSVVTPVLNTVSAMEYTPSNMEIDNYISEDSATVALNEMDLNGFKYANAEEGFTYEVSDSTILAKLAKQGYDVSEYQNNNKRRHRRSTSSRGVTKFVKVNGGWNLYVSSTVAKIIIKGGGIGAAAVVAAIPGIGWAVAGAIAGVVANEFTDDFVTFGVVFKYRSRTDKITVSRQ